MKRGKGLWESDIRYGYMTKNVRVAFHKGVINYITVPLQVSQQNTKPARPVYNRGTGSGTLWDRNSKDPTRYLDTSVGPKMRKFLLEEIIENSRVPKTKRNRICHKSACRCWICNITAFKGFGEHVNPPRGFLSRTPVLSAIEEKDKQAINDGSRKKGVS